MILPTTSIAAKARPDPRSVGGESEPLAKLCPVSFAVQKGDLAGERLASGFLPLAVAFGELPERPSARKHTLGQRLKAPVQEHEDG
eukprot:11813532-Alexandrium_andersonii.AAC.1